MMKKKLSLKKTTPEPKKEAENPETPAVVGGAPEAVSSEKGAEAAPAGKKGGLKKGVGSKPVKPGRVAAAKPVSKPKKPLAPRKERPARTPRAGIPFICSECYEEFVLPSTYSRETVSCPECMHVGKRPAEDFLRTVALHKSGERNALKMAVSSTCMLLVWSLAFLWLLSPYSHKLIGGEMRDTLTKVLGGLVFLLVLLLGWAAYRYEKNRWEIYF
jgi:hypothetical protein